VLPSRALASVGAAGEGPCPRTAAAWAGPFGCFEGCPTFGGDDEGSTDDVAARGAHLSVGRARGAKRALYDNCTNFHTKYPHGVGRVTARDHSKSGLSGTNFLRSTRIYDIAMKYNDDLDRDDDGVACEKK
jgi:hypothetical protein